MKKKIENKRQKFVRLAELRTEKAVLAIENLLVYQIQGIMTIMQKMLI